MKKKPQAPSDPSIEILEKLLGSVEEMSSNEVTFTIAEAGIDLAAARETLYNEASEKRAQLWEKNAPVTSDISSLLVQFRPHRLPSSDPEVAQQAAASWLRDLVDRRMPRNSEIQFATAARNLDGTLTSGDQDIMRELEEELRSDQQVSDDPNET